MIAGKKSGCSVPECDSACTVIADFGDLRCCDYERSALEYASNRSARDGYHRVVLNGIENNLAYHANQVHILLFEAIDTLIHKRCPNSRLFSDKCHLDECPFLTSLRQTIGGFKEQP